MLYGLDYLRPTYCLRWNDSDIRQLSPGERGTLLLAFYLIIDNDEKPLVIDQPEDNLDNQTVYDVLVPAINHAKKRRQIIIVTHNPNLAVVCDANQVIYASHEPGRVPILRYESGSLESPDTRNHVVDVLEGTMPAFDKRDAKYDVVGV